MSTYILILFAYVGPFTDRDPTSITTAAFQTEQACRSAGNMAADLAKGTTKIIKFACAPTGAKP